MDRQPADLNAPSPQASVVVPTWNRAPMLRRCLEALALQDHSSFEVIVVDDASSDATQAVLKEVAAAHPDFRLRWLRNDHHTGGRKQGTPNQINREIRELIREALDREGGVQYLRKAAREQPVAFLGLVAKLLPAEFKGTLESGPVVIHVNTGIRDSPGSHVDGRPEHRRRPELGLGEPPSESSDAVIELAKSSVVEMESAKPVPHDKPQPETWVPLRPDENERPKVAQLD